MKIVFMGTPEFAVTALEALLEANLEVVGVVTSPDKPAGRGQKISESAVKQFAMKNSLPILQPLKLKDDQFLTDLKAWNADLFVVVAFRMLPEVVWQMPPKGTINLHGSLLPQYRGAAPINHAIINGEIETGVSTFFLQQEIDTGNLIFSEKMPILEKDTAGDVHDKMMHLGANVLVKTIKAIESGDYNEIPQNSSEPLKPAPKIFKEFCKIDWNQPTLKIYNHIRGLSPYPTAFTTFHDKTLKIFSVEMEDKEPGISPGAFISDNKTYLKFATKDGFISVLTLQLEGKKKMAVEEFLRGIRL